MTDSILESAFKIIHGNRQESYGDPATNLNRIAAHWNTYLSSKFMTSYVTLTAEDVCWMMTLLKMSRQMHRHDRDNLVDAAGYIGLIEKLQ